MTTRIGDNIYEPSTDNKLYGRFPLGNAIVSKPKGMYASEGYAIPAVTTHAELHGMLIGTTWSDIETSEGVYDFSAIECKLNGYNYNGGVCTGTGTSANSVRTLGLNWSLAIACGPNTPDYIKDNVAVDLLTYTWIGGAEFTTPYVWDSYVQTKYAAMIAAVGAQYASDPTLVLVYVSQFGQNGNEGLLPKSLVGTTWATLGFVDADYISGTLANVDACIAAFPFKPIALELHDFADISTAGDTYVTDSLLSTFETDLDYIDRVGVGMWWIDGDTDYQAQLITDLTAFTGNIYAQVIGQSGTPERFPSGYAAVYTQAKTIGIEYIEAWNHEYDVGIAPTWDATFNDFNAWSA